MRPSLASRISFAIVGVLALAMLNSIVAIGSAYRFETFHSTLVAENLESVLAAEELEIALLEQRGLVASYILEGGNEAWLQRLEEKKNKFQDWLGRARDAARSDGELDILDRLELVHDEYAESRDIVVKLYKSGEEVRAREVLLNDVVDSYDLAFEMCEEFISENKALVDSTTARIRLEVERITIIVTVVLVVSVFLSFALLWLFFIGVIMPLRRISAEVRCATGDELAAPGAARSNELQELRHYAELLMANVAESRSDLEQSRRQLAHADKLAAVGKLAAGVAHEIRNPLTSMKMWLYSLRRSVAHNGDIEQKFDVISDELSRLENIVRSFLEFARPLKLDLKAQPVQPIIDKTLELACHHLEDTQIALHRTDEPELPLVVADAEQLRQVLLNLINNAIDAMPGGGHLWVSSTRSNLRGRSMVTVRVADSGAGIPDDVRNRLFEPFFSTKEEGNGLGLCIAASAMARQKGLLVLDSSNSRGTQWTVWIPTAGPSGAAD